MSQQTGAPSAIKCYGTHSNVLPRACPRTKDGFCSWIPQHMFTASDPAPGSGAIRRSTMWLNPKTPDVLVIGGGNAALCAALMAPEAGASVLLLESAARVAWRQLGAHAQPALHARCAAGRAGRGLPRGGVLAGPAQGDGRPDQRTPRAPCDPRLVGLPRLDAQPRRALPAAAIG